ncbi:MAG: hypothetical protein ABR865_15525 [Terracidiphilus sp.]
MWRLAIAMILFGAGCCVTAQDLDSVANAKAQELAQKIRSCSPREVVGASSAKHHKQAWYKEQWGAPVDVFASVTRTSDLLHPYEITIEFSLALSVGDEKQAEAEAREDTNLHPFPGPLGRNYKNRNIYLWGKSDLVLKTREVFSDSPFSQTLPAWTSRPSWPDACWDWIGTDKEFQPSEQ